MIKTYLTAWAIILFTYLLLDGVWLGIIAKNGYSSAMGNLLRDNFIIWPWVIFYLLYTFAIAHLVVMPNINSAIYIPVIVSAALFGAAAYGAYNLTNYAVVQDWPLGITLKDWCWGTVVTTASSLSGWFITRYIIYSGG